MNTNVLRIISQLDEKLNDVKEAPEFLRVDYSSAAKTYNGNLIVLINISMNPALFITINSRRKKRYHYTSDSMRIVYMINSEMKF